MQKVEGGVKGQPVPKKVRKTPSQPTSQEWWYTAVIPGMWKALVGGLRSEVNSGQNLMTQYEK
jgi:hypothetical protein